MQQSNKNIMFNGHNINDSIDSTMETYRAGQYKNFGTLLGKTLIEATIEEDLFLY